MAWVKDIDFPRELYSEDGEFVQEIQYFIQLSKAFITQGQK